MATTKQKYPTIRISADTHKLVKQMAEEDDVSMSDIVAEAVKQYERKRFWQRANEIWAAKMRDPEEREFWAKEDAEIERVFWSPIIEPWEENDEGNEYPEENAKAE